MNIYQLRVSIIGISKVYRIIEATGNCSFDDLHETIFNAFDRYDPHLYSFFLTRKGTKNLRAIFNAPEFTHPMNLEDLWDIGTKERYDAQKTKIGSLDLNEKEKFYYLFDFGDDWWHEVTVLTIQTPKTVQAYPRIVKKVGESPEQYPNYEDEYEDGDDLV